VTVCVDPTLKLIDIYTMGGFLFRINLCPIMAWVLWFTGLPGCGKTTIAQLVKMILIEKGLNVKILQLDEIRRIITPQPKYSEEERECTSIVVLNELVGVWQ